MRRWFPLAQAIVAMAVTIVASGASPDESAEVYEAMFSDLGVANHTYFIRETVENPEDDGSDYPYKGIFAKLRAEKKRDRHHQTDFGSMSVHLVHEDEYIELFSDGCREGWQRFHQRYPRAKALLGLSSVGFVGDGTEAVVYLKVGSACFGGTGALVVLKRSQGKWKTKSTLNLWIS
jgi:hypothetical protein